MNVAHPAGHPVAQAASSVSVTGRPQGGTVVVVSNTHRGLIHVEVSNVHAGLEAVVVIVYGAQSVDEGVSVGRMMIGPPGLMVVFGSAGAVGAAGGMVVGSNVGSSCSVMVSV